MQQVVIKIKDCVKCQFIGLDSDDMNMLYKKYSMFVPTAIFQPKYKLGIWDGYAHHFTATGITCVNFIDEILESIDTKKYEIIYDYSPNLLEAPVFTDIDNTYLNEYIWYEGHRLEGQRVELFDHQVDIINTCLMNPRCLIEAATGCHAKGTKILMYDGQWKNVEDIVVGDKLMGDDGKVRNVLSLHRGKDDMYCITPTKSKSFVVNGGHILPVICNNKRSKEYLKISNISVNEYINQSKTYKHTHKIFNNKTQIDFGNNYNYIITPYIMGVYLGDGSTRGNGTLEITTMDKEIVEELQCEANKNNLNLVEHIDKRGNQAKNYSFNLLNHNDKNIMKEELKRYGLFEKKSIDKFIPDEYLYGSTDTRLNVLAGLIDTDGSYDFKRQTLEYYTNSKQLVDGVCFICGSLGLKTYVHTKKVKTYPNNIYYRISISGDISIIPTKIERKKVKGKKPNKDCRHSSIKIEYIGKDNYYGFECDGNHLYIMEDWWIQHNSGKTIISFALAKKVSEFGKFVIIEPSRDLTLQTAETFNKLGLECGVCGCGKRELDKPIVICTWQTLNSLEKRKKNDYLDEDKRLLSAEELKKLKENMIGILFDEVHTAKAYQVQKICTETFGNIPIRWGLTGTIPKDKTDKIGLVMALGPVVHHLDSKELQDKGILANCDITCIKLKDDANFFQYSDEMTYLSLNEDRLKFISNLLSQVVKTKGNTLVLVNRIKTGEILEEKLKLLNCDCVFLDGSVKSEERFKEYKSINEVNNKIIIATAQICSTGLDIPRLFNLVFLDFGKSFVKIIQSIGRGLRIGRDKTHVDIFDIFSTTKFSKKHFNDRVHYYDEKKFPFKVLNVDVWK